MNRWANYLNKTAQQMSLNAEKAAIIEHASSTGNNREEILGNFLRSHLPSRLIPKSNAKVFSVEGAESKEVDLLVINDISINFLNEMRMFTNAESVASAITVKSFLNKNDFTVQ